MFKLLYKITLYSRCQQLLVITKKKKITRLLLWKTDINHNKRYRLLNRDSNYLESGWNPGPLV